MSKSSRSRNIQVLPRNACHQEYYGSTSIFVSLIKPKKQHMYPITAISKFMYPRKVPFDVTLHDVLQCHWTRNIKKYYVYFVINQFG